MWAGYTGGPRYALGHELVGEVVAAGEGARWRVGDRVTATSPFEETPEAITYAMNQVGLKTVVVFEA